MELEELKADRIADLFEIANKERQKTAINLYSVLYRRGMSIS